MLVVSSPVIVAHRSIEDFKLVSRSPLLDLIWLIRAVDVELMALNRDVSSRSDISLIPSVNLPTLSSPWASHFKERRIGWVEMRWEKRASDGP